MNKHLRYLYPVIFLIASAIGTTMLMSPVYAEELGADYMSLGVMGALQAGGYTVMTIVAGLLMDRFEKIRLYSVFAALNVVAVGAFAFSNSVNQITILRGARAWFDVWYILGVIQLHHREPLRAHRLDKKHWSL